MSAPCGKRVDQPRLRCYRRKVRVWRASGSEYGRHPHSSLAELDNLLPTGPRARREIVETLAELAPGEGWEARLEVARKWKVPNKDVRLPLGRLVGAVVRSLEVSLGKDLAQRAEKKIDQLLLRDATQQLDVKGGFIIWRSKHGARKHRLLIPDVVPGDRLWTHAKLVGRWRGAHPTLRAISLGDSRLARHLARFCTVTPVDPSSIRTFSDQEVDLALIAAHLFDESTRVSREEIAEFCRRLCERGAIIVVWFEGTPTCLHLPEGMKAFLLSEAAETEAWLKSQLGENVLQRAGHIGPLESDEEPLLPQAVGPYVLQLGSENTEALPLPGFTHVSYDVLSARYPPNSTAAAHGRANALLLRHVRSFSTEDWRRVRSALRAGFVPVLARGERESLPPLFSSMPHLESEVLALDPTALTAEQGQLSRRFANMHLGPDVAAQRLSFVLGIPPLVRTTPLVSVLCVSNRPALIGRCIESYRKQRYPKKELILVLNEASMPETKVLEVLAEYPDITLLRSPPECSLGESLNRARAVSRGEYWTKMDDDDHYAENYLSDLILTCKSKGANVCGKGTFFTYFQSQRSLFLSQEAAENEWSDQYIHGGTILARRRDVEGIDFPPVRQGTDTLFLRQCVSAGLRIYSADRYNFAYVRYAEPGHHTFDVSHKRLRRHSVLVGDNLDLSSVDV